MNGSYERVSAVVRGDMPDRPPLYDLLRNDAVLSYFAGEPLTIENAASVVFRAYEPAIDATRPMVRLPQEEGAQTRPDGRAERRFRWTTWTDHVRYADGEAYAKTKREYLKSFDPAWTLGKQNDLDSYLASVSDHRRRLGEVFFFPGAPLLGLMGICGEIGLEHFSYYLADYPDLTPELLECHALSSCVWIQRLPEDHGIEAVFAGDDIAFKSGPFLAPSWFRDHYFPKLSRVLDAYHARGIKVLFHSDGNLNPLLDGLVEAGVDGLNPMEVLAGMDVGVVHRRYPHLFMTGAIDVSQLLPHGTPEQIRDTVRRALDDSEGRLMVGSSTELNNEVPLRNFLALREAALEYHY